MRRKGRATVPMNDALKAALVEAKAAALTPHVIEWAGHPIKSIKKGLKAAGKSIGRHDTSPHMLRHSADVWFAEDGRDHAVPGAQEFPDTGKCVCAFLADPSSKVGEQRVFMAGFSQAR